MAADATGRRRSRLRDRESTSPAEGARGVQRGAAGRTRCRRARERRVRRPGAGLLAGVAGRPSRATRGRWPVRHRPPDARGCRHGRPAGLLGHPPGRGRRAQANAARTRWAGGVLRRREPGRSRGRSAVAAVRPGRRRLAGDRPRRRWPGHPRRLLDWRPADDKVTRQGLLIARTSPGDRGARAGVSRRPGGRFPRSAGVVQRDRRQCDRRQRGGRRRQHGLVPEGGGDGERVGRFARARVSGRVRRRDSPASRLIGTVPKLV